MTDTPVIRPPRVPRRRPSPLPFELNRGVSWKVVAWGLGLLAAMVVPTATILVKMGAAQEQLTAIRAEVSGMRSRQEELQVHVAALQVKADAHEVAIDRIRARIEKLRDSARE